MIRILLGLLAFSFWANSAKSQILEPAPDKAVVYFFRYSPTGFLVGFSYYDGREFIGKTANTNYIRYECEPGQHLFWASAENRSFIEADLFPGKIYAVEVRPEFGAVASRVRLIPMSGKEKIWKKVQRLVEKKECSPIVVDQDFETVRELRQKRALEGQLRYQKLKDKGKKIAYLAPEMHVALSDFEYLSRKEKKKREKENAE